MNSLTSVYLVRQLQAINSLIPDQFKNEIFELNRIWNSEDIEEMRFRYKDFEFKRVSDGIDYSDVCSNNNITKADILDMMMQCLNSIK
jgi:hypothetical protein